MFGLPEAYQSPNSCDLLSKNPFFWWAGYIRVPYVRFCCGRSTCNFPQNHPQLHHEKNMKKNAKKKRQKKKLSWFWGRPTLFWVGSKKTKLFFLGKISGWMMRTSNISTWISFLTKNSLPEVPFFKSRLHLTIRFPFHLSNHRLPGVFCFRSRADICPWAYADLAGWNLWPFAGFHAELLPHKKQHGCLCKWRSKMVLNWESMYNHYISLCQVLPSDPFWSFK